MVHTRGRRSRSPGRGPGARYPLVERARVGTFGDITPASKPAASITALGRFFRSFNDKDPELSAARLA